MQDGAAMPAPAGAAVTAADVQESRRAFMHPAALLFVAGLTSRGRLPCDHQHWRGVLSLQGPSARACGDLTGGPVPRTAMVPGASDACQLAGVRPRGTAALKPCRLPKPPCSIRANRRIAFGLRESGWRTSGVFGEWHRSWRRPFGRGRCSRAAGDLKRAIHGLYAQGRRENQSTLMFWPRAVSESCWCWQARGAGMWEDAADA
jgi:hypothetical protein